MTGRRRTLIVLALVATAWGAAVSAQERIAATGPETPSASSTNYALDWVVLDANGGGAAQSTTYRAGLTIGQTAVGVTAGTAGQAEMGFWYGVDRELFCDGFESGDSSAWDLTVGG